LESFSVHDVIDLEFLVTVESSEIGRIKLLKTKDIFLVEADVSFEICKEIECEEDYNFPSDSESLLIDSHPSHMKVLKDIFKTRLEFLELTFTAK